MARADVAVPYTQTEQARINTVINNYTAAVPLDGLGNVSGTITSTATPSFVSASGFKQTIYAGGWAIANAALPTTYTNLYTSLASSNTAGITFPTQGYITTRSGSVTGLSVYVNQTAPSTMVVRLVINGNISNQLIATTSNTGLAIPKGQLTFGPNQIIYVQIGFLTNPTATFQMLATFEIETAA